MDLFTGIATFNIEFLDPIVRAYARYGLLCKGCIGYVVLFQIIVDDQLNGILIGTNLYYIRYVADMNLIVSIQ